MKKAFKIILWSLLSVIVLTMAAVILFAYKVQNGFPVSYETDKPLISFPAGRLRVLLFSKSTGFRHGESIEVGEKVFTDLAIKNNWFLYATEKGGVFNPEQLARFNVVVFNNCTGRLLNQDQQTALQHFVQRGGHWIGIHGAGDFSHHWDWYEQNLVGARFSHHPVQAHLQEAMLTLQSAKDSELVQGLPQAWAHTDEWYVFYDHPRANGCTVIYSIDGEKINPNGNFLWIKDKNFGMGKDHPVAWCKTVGRGWSFYTSMGHDATAWKQPAFVGMLENAVLYSR